MIELNIQDLRKKALIKFSACPEGHVFSVRKKNPGDELALSEMHRRRSKLIITVSELQAKSLESREAAPEVKDSITKDIEKAIKDIDKLEQDEMKIKARIFDDGGDGTLAVALYNELSDDDLNALLEAVMNDKSIEKSEE